MSRWIHTLDRGRSAPARARAAVREALDPVLAGEAMERVALMTSETVTNAFALAPRDEAHVRLSVAHHERVVRVAVEDRRGPGAEGDEAWGDWLGRMIVSRLSDRWGARHTELGTEIWFEIDVPPARDP